MVSQEPQLISVNVLVILFCPCEFVCAAQFSIMFRQVSIQVIEPQLIIYYYLIGAFASIFAKRRRAESFEAYCQWVLLTVQIITLL